MPAVWNFEKQLATTAQAKITRVDIPVEEKCGREKETGLPTLIKVVDTGKWKPHFLISKTCNHIWVYLYVDKPTGPIFETELG